MNIQEYISSGVLEAYVLGDLPLDQKNEVEAYAKQYSEIQEEIEKIELTLEAVAFETAIAPPSTLKASFLERIEALEEEEETKVVDMPPSALADDTIRPIQSGNSGFYKYVAAASVVIALGASYLAFNYYSKWKETEGELVTLIAQNERVAQDYNQVNQKLESIEQDFNVLNDASFTRVAMNGTDNNPRGLAYIYWNASSEDVYLSIQSLKALSQEKQYQLWAIIDGAPVDAGVFDASGKQQLIKMKNIGNAAAFAVTIEPKGGSVNPSLETMQVVGNVEKS